MVHRIALEVAGSHFVIEDADPERASLLKRLWAGFLSEVPDPDGQAIAIAPQGPGWSVSVAGEDDVPATDFWDVADALRSYIVSAALDRAEGLLDLHAAVMVRDGEALLLAGRSAAGKTSLGLELYERGWACFGDDVAPVDARSGEILSFPVPVRVRDVSMWPRFEAVWGLPTPPSPKEAFQLPVGAMTREEGSAARPTHIFFLSPILGPGAEVQEITSAESAAECGRFVTRLDRSRLQLLRELCEKCRNYRLNAPSASAAADSLLDCLSRSREGHPRFG
jgi:hypothetical protein